MLDHKVYFLHVLAWFYVHGKWCKIDHIDRVKVHNWISNLRPATRIQNLANQDARITNMLNVKGVQQRGQKFRAYITVNYQMMHLGTFDTLEEAIAARAEAANYYRGEFSNG